jgi:hypothetical protein
VKKGNGSKVVKCKLVTVWNNDWITSAKVKSAIDPAKIIKKAKLKSLKPLIKAKEISLFKSLGEFES